MSDSTSPLLIEPDELARELQAPNLRVLDATVFLVPAGDGYRAESGLPRYQERHIPGAAFMDLIREFSDTSSELGFTLPTVDALAAAIGRLGVSNGHRVVVYASGHPMWATRAFWLLRYAGHDHVSVLNGGLQGWIDAGHELRDTEDSYAPAHFSPRPRPELFVDLTQMRDAVDDPAVCTVNALSPEVYAGTGAAPYGRPGHIPGSLNVHYETLMDGSRFRPAAELRETLSDRGLLDAGRVVAYCGGGISATIDAFACLLAGKTDVAVYDGSMSEWARDPTLPLTTGEAP